jgi:hypothetical protein
LRPGGQDHAAPRINVPDCALAILHELGWDDGLTGWSGSSSLPPWSSG